MKRLMQISVLIPLFVLLTTAGTGGLRLVLDSVHQDAMSEVFQREFVRSVDEATLEVERALVLGDREYAQKIIDMLVGRHGITRVSVLSESGTPLLSSQVLNHSSPALPARFGKEILHRANSGYQQWSEAGVDFVLRPLPIGRLENSLQPDIRGHIFVESLFERHSSLIGAFQGTWMTGIAMILSAGLLVTWFVQSRVTRRLKQLSRSAAKASQDYQFEGEPHQYDDEIGELAASLVNSFSAVRDKQEELLVERQLQQALSSIYRILAKPRSTEELTQLIEKLQYDSAFFSSTALLLWQDGCAEFSSPDGTVVLPLKLLPEPQILPFEEGSTSVWKLDNDDNDTSGFLFEASYLGRRYGAVKLRITDARFGPRGMEVAAQLASASAAVLAHLSETAQRALIEQALSIRNAEYQVLFDAIQDAVIICSEDGQIFVANPAAHRLCGASEGALPGTQIDVLMPDSVAGLHSQHVARFLARQSREPGGLQMPREIRMKRLDGSLVNVDITLGHYQADREYLFVAIIRDISDRVQREKKIAFLADYDALTGLPNRRHLDRLLEEALEDATRGACSVGVALIDLDNFKNVNDRLGHSAGDQLLCEVAGRISQILRRQDVLARFGGDEFVLLLPKLPVDEEAALIQGESLLNRLLEVLKPEFVINGNRFRVGASIGIAFSPSDSTSEEALLQFADSAMYAAKSDGKNAWRAYDVVLSRTLAESHRLENELEDALSANEFKMYVQPQVLHGDNRIVAVEALMRWIRADGSLCNPADFIPVAEKTGKIIPMGYWMIQQALAFIAQQPALQHISVNVSPVQFREKSFVEQVIGMVAKSGVAPQRLVLEITENLLLETKEGYVDEIQQLAAAGIKLSIDDFGTGYSCLAYLHRLPISELKIDRSFVSGLGREPRKRSLIETFLGIGRDFELKVVAEGVETEGEAALLKSLGCDLYQGYLCSPPLPIDKFEALTARWNDRIKPESAPPRINV